MKGRVSPLVVVQVEGRGLRAQGHSVSMLLGQPWKNSSTQGAGLGLSEACWASFFPLFLFPLLPLFFFLAFFL